MRTNYRSYLTAGYSPAAPTENVFVISNRQGLSKKLPPLVYCHGSGDTSQTIYNPYGKLGQFTMLRALARRYVVVAADLGGQVWGNDTHISRVSDAVEYAASLTNHSGDKVTLVGASMGNLGALGWARTHQSDIAAYVGVIPALDLAQLLPFAPAEINGAYGGAYNDATHGSTHSPVKYANQFKVSLPMTLYTASNDNICLPYTATQFVQRRPDTNRVDLGPLGHTENAILHAIDPILEFLGDSRKEPT